MLFRSATSVAILACAASATAKPQPYKLAVMAVPGQSLLRRDTSGYQPEETVCGDGNTCAEACGDGYSQCPSNDASVHCFNADAAQSCCSDGTGNSCEAGYYCTHDHDLQTWCCPDSMDLSECAAAYSVTGGLETPEPTTSTSASSTTSATPSTTSTPSSTPTPSTTSTPYSTSTTPCVTPSHSWTTGVNSTVTNIPVPTGTTPVPVPPPADTTPATPTPEPSQPGSGASASGVSLALLVAAAGFVALL